MEIAKARDKVCSSFEEQEFDSVKCASVLSDFV